MVGVKTKEILPGTYSVPKDISQELAEKIRKFGRAEIIVEKKAPENKVVRTPKSKAKVGQVYGSSTGAITKRRGRSRNS